jgi:hypothetical protein
MIALGASAASMNPFDETRVLDIRTMEMTNSTAANSFINERRPLEIGASYDKIRH